MTQCGECGFAVNETMKFALKQNACPACGSALFSNKDSSLITMIQGKIQGEGFSRNFTEDMVYDVSLFVFNEIKYGLGKILRDEALNSSLTSEIEYSEEDLDDEEARIKREVEAEFSESLSQLTEDGDVQDEEVFSKAERLKRLHEQRVKSNPKITEGVINSGAKKRGGFKGINRSS